MNENPAHKDFANDLLEGAADIAEFIYGDRNLRRKVYNLAAESRGAEKIPCFRIGAIIYARKSTLISWIAAREVGDPS